MAVVSVILLLACQSRAAIWRAKMLKVQEAATYSRENSKGCEAQPVVPGPSCHALRFTQRHQGLEEGRANNSYGRDDMPKIRHHGHAFSNDLRRNKEAGRNKLAALPSKTLQIEHASQK
ncbi:MULTISPECIES: hypothetical protein [Brucella]|uniref:hypothetical protein n=2 Tax=Brucella/Ochrobactrum group TaxID=2826938 RepID=UPI0011B0710D|nr:hypothetical protein [Brucella rhizosphaerae]